MKKRLEFIVRLSIPFSTDSNVIRLCVNPAANRNLAVANRFVRRLFSTLKVTPGQPIKTKEYFVSYTSLDRRRTGERQLHRVLEELGIDPATFRDAAEDPNGDADHIFLLRHALMNPWLLFPDDNGTNTVDRYLTFLDELIRNFCQRDGEE